MNPNANTCKVCGQQFESWYQFLGHKCSA
ncbi:hypothetical protein VTP21DRAFT_8268 [Calcarisporiella thermophila]